MKAVIDLLQMTLEDDLQWNRKGRQKDLEKAISVLQDYDDLKGEIEQRDLEISNLKKQLHKLHQQGDMNDPDYLQSIQ